MLFKDFYDMYAYDMYKLWLKWIPITSKKDMISETYSVVNRNTNEKHIVYDYDNRDISFMKFLCFAYENSF